MFTAFRQYNQLTILFKLVTMVTTYVTSHQHKVKQSFKTCYHGHIIAFKHLSADVKSKETIPAPSGVDLSN